MDNAPSFRTFLGAFRKHWFALMSGGLSVPFTAGTVYVDGKWPKAGFAFLALVCGFYAAFVVWRDERIARNVAETELARISIPSKWHAVAEELGGFVEAGDALLKRCWYLSAETTEVLAPAVAAWIAEIEACLATLGSAYVLRFRNEIGVPSLPAGIYPVTDGEDFKKGELWSMVRCRLFRLNEFITEAQARA